MPQKRDRIANRSMPESTVIPELIYPDLARAVEWLCDAFGFTERLRIGNHRAQLNVGDGSIVAVAGHSESGPSDSNHSVMVRVPDVNRHFAHSKKRGAKILRPPADYPFGERQYTTEDLAGHVWTFSESIADVAPEEWGGQRPDRKKTAKR